ncbi:DUF6484 domain-containing protein [Marinimicrobium agarilyticum]|uniref:DUF6484 domain-containing protein n=1 Tax=Marinimicrobium agarilyticum TaxID=306546 RepID=UPI0004237B43|nr:DUF6484 domain-containing protein [Marinimicrobium agarilyticum]
MTETSWRDAEAAGDTEVLEEHWPQGEFLLGTLVDLDDQGLPCVRVAYKGAYHRLLATPATRVTREALGRQAVVMFAGGSIQAPVLLGFVHSPLDMALEEFAGESEETSPGKMEAEVDGQKTVIEGKQQIVLRCGAASITLTESGKIVLRGEHLVSRSSGVNRILGASIQMN